MNHLETLVRQCYEWQGYIVKGNVKVGRLSHGGWAGELDIVAYHPQTRHLIHIEPSIDAHSWKKREERFKKKFLHGREYIYQEVFPWLDKKTPLEQVAILVNSGRDTVAGCRVESIDQFMSCLKKKIEKEGKMAQKAIAEQYGLLRTIQMTICGYSRRES